jgi:hypothetical protein
MVLDDCRTDTSHPFGSEKVMAAIDLGNELGGYDDDETNTPLSDDMCKSSQVEPSRDMINLGRLEDLEAKGFMTIDPRAIEHAQNWATHNWGDTVTAMQNMNPIPHGWYNIGALEDLKHTHKEK